MKTAKHLGTVDTLGRTWEVWSVPGGYKEPALRVMLDMSSGWQRSDQ